MSVTRTKKSFLSVVNAIDVLNEVNQTYPSMVKQIEGDTEETQNKIDEFNRSVNTATVILRQVQNTFNYQSLHYMKEDLQNV